MALKFALSAEEHEGLSDALKEHYVEDEQTNDDGEPVKVFVLSMDGEHPSVAGLKTKLREARNETNQRGKKIQEREDELATLKEQIDQFKDVDPDEYRRLKAEFDKAKRAAKAAGKGDVEDMDAAINAAVEKAVTQATAPLKKQLEAAQTREREATEKAFNQRLTNTITEAAAKGGVVEGAISDIQHRARSAGWTLDEDDNLIRKNGDEIVVDEDGLPEVFGDYLLNMKKGDAPFLFKGSTGAGARPGGGGGGGRPQRREAARIIKDASNEDFLSNLDDIAAGKVGVGRSDQRGAVQGMPGMVQ